MIIVILYCENRKSIREMVTKIKWYIYSKWFSYLEILMSAKYEREGAQMCCFFLGLGLLFISLSQIWNFRKKGSNPRRHTFTIMHTNTHGESRKLIAINYTYFSSRPKLDMHHRSEKSISFYYTHTYIHIWPKFSDSAGDPRLILTSAPKSTRRHTAN